MLHKTTGVVLRSVKYGDSSLITTIFTAAFGIQAYMVRGVRSARTKQNRAGSFQPGVLLDLVVYNHPQKNLQRINEYKAAYIYTGLHEDVLKNSMLLFSCELLLLLLSEQGPLPDLFDFVYDYLVTLDKMPVGGAGNFPLYFIIRSFRLMGFDLKGHYSSDTPYLDLAEGGFSAQHTTPTLVTDEDARALDALLKITDYHMLAGVQLGSAARFRLIDWYLAFLRLHTQSSRTLKSLSVLRTILH